MRREAIRRFRPPHPRLTAVIAVLAAAGLVTWVVAHGSGPSTVEPVAAPASTREATSTITTRSAPLPQTVPKSGSGAAGSSIGPVSVTAKGLRTLVLSFQQPVYWAGPAQGGRYELTRTEAGNVFVRYLPPGVKAGAKRELLTVGTYPFPGAFAETQALAKQRGALSRRVSGGGLAYFRRDQPHNVYLVYPQLDYQIEVFSPAGAQARQLVVSGSIRPIR